MEKKKVFRFIRVHKECYIDDELLSCMQKQVATVCIRRKSLYEQTESWQQCKLWVNHSNFLSVTVTEEDSASITY